MEESDRPNGYRSYDALFEKWYNFYWEAIKVYEKIIFEQKTWQIFWYSWGFRMEIKKIYDHFNVQS